MTSSPQGDGNGKICTESMWERMRFHDLFPARGRKPNSFGAIVNSDIFHDLFPARGRKLVRAELPASEMF